ncbi:dTDP-4-dehydrorhamnose reductase, partial [Akkermansiaceae bacterium]|nr:dTDP-4-dehydrorhamnose reductase [Akkermansiaceae bacterium]
MIKVLLTGANGQLGHFVQKHAPEFETIELIAYGRETIDLSELKSLKNTILSFKPDVVINGAAYTAVDKAEEEKDLAMLINGHAVGEIAKACEEINASLIHISTDYVFDGTKTGGYDTTDITCPVNHYGATKLKGEELALQYCSRCMIVRTSWVHSEFGTNFETTMKRLFKERKTLKVINDQIGKPTHATILAQHCLKLALQHPISSKITHYCGPEIMTWYDFANKLLSQTNSPVTKEILPIPTSEYPTPAKRPANSVL